MVEQATDFKTGTYVRLFKVACVTIGPSWWSGHPTCSSFWRLYHNEDDGAALIINGQLIPLERHKLYVVPSGILFTTHSTRDVAQFYIHFDVIGLPRVYQENLFNSLIKIPDEPGLAQQASLLASEIRADHKDDIGLQCKALGLLYQVLSAFLDHLPDEQRRRYADRAMASLPVLPAIEAMETRFAEPLRNVDLARLCCLSETYFIERFHDCVGITPAQYLQAIRIRMASRSLLFTDATVDSVAQTNGFASRSHFTRTFRRHTGKTPSEFRSELTTW